MLQPIALYASALSHAVYEGSSSSFKRLGIYYGWLLTSNLKDLDIDILVISGSSRVKQGDDYQVIQDLRSKKVEVYAYVHDENDNPVGMGSSFKTMVYDNTTGALEERYSYWVSRIKSYIDTYQNIVDGVFLDECDPGYFTSNLDDEEVKWFSWGLGNITGYAHSIELKSMVNGVMDYANIGDYYLWEVFLTFYNSTSDSYELITDFLQPTNYNSPLEWVNGYSRYEYLKAHDLLNKTLAITQADPSQEETVSWANAGYMLAKIMGLIGWGAANGYYYSQGGPMPLQDFPIYEIGVPISDALIDSNENTARRVFSVVGNVTLEFTGNDVRITVSPGYPFDTKRIIVDGTNNSEYSELLLQSVSGVYSQLSHLGINHTASGMLYLYASWTYTGQDSAGGLFHIYIDYDGSSSTGYRKGDIGADYMVEVTSTDYAALYKYSGTGTEWTWSRVSRATLVMKTSPIYICELSVALNYSATEKFVASVVYNWNDDAITGAINALPVYIMSPNIFEKSSQLSSYTGLVERIRLYSNRLETISNGPSETLVNYTLIVPFIDIEKVLANGTPLPKYNGDGEGYQTNGLPGSYSRVVVIVEHNSPLNITVIGARSPYPIPEPEIIVSLITLAIVGFSACRAKRKYIK